MTDQSRQSVTGCEGSEPSVDHEYKFDSRPLQTARYAFQNSQIAATVRADDERDVEAGDAIGLLTTDSEMVGAAEVAAVTQTPAGNAVATIGQKEACYSFDSGMRLLVELNEYYDGSEPIYPETEVTIIFYEVATLEVEKIPSGENVSEHTVAETPTIPEPGASDWSGSRLSLQDERPECTHCGSVIEERAVVVRSGEWNGQAFATPNRTKWWCRECYNRHRRRDAAAHYPVTDSGELWEILAAADGSLVADLSTIFSSGGWVRIIDREPQVLAVSREMDAKQNVLRFEAEPIEWSKQTFHERMETVKEATSDEKPTPTVALRPVGETPFAEWVELPTEQTTLEVDVEQDELGGKGQ
jgi:hypothetical protein